MRKKILISGASSGIGLALSKRFTQEPCDFLLVALDENGLYEAKASLQDLDPQALVHILCLDLSISGAAQMVYAHCQKHAFFPDVLVNNAGFGTHGFVVEQDVQTELSMLQLHVQTIYQLCRLFLPQMQANQYGRIINISSISAFQPNPLLATYGASKAFVYHFSRALDWELRQLPGDLRSLTICPTPVRTNFGKGTSIYQSALFSSWMCMDVEEVAEDIYRSYQKGRSVRVPGARFHWLSRISRKLPESLQIYLSYLHLKM